MQKTSKKWIILGTGGTIAGVASHQNDHTGYTAGQLSVETLLQATPGLRAGLQSDTVVAEQVAQVDSKDMTYALWQHIALRCAYWLAQMDVAGVLLLHGTDTMEETAWFLQSVLAPDKPVVLTGAMRPSTAQAPDGPQNILDALAVAQSGMVKTVCVVMSGQIWAAADVRKVHPYRLDALASSDGTCAGWVEQGVVRGVNSLLLAQTIPHPQAQQALTRVPEQWPWVEVVHSCAGAQARSLEVLLEAGVQGLVVAGTGNGSVHESWLSVLHQAQQQGVEVRLTSRCTFGRLVGAPWMLPLVAPSLSPYQARISLLLDLMKTPYV